jgi:hypothetical protein
MNMRDGLDLQYGHGHAAWTWKNIMDLEYGMEMKMQQEPRRAVWTLKRSTDMVMQHEH